jgi:hypothetical protein
MDEVTRRRFIADRAGTTAGLSGLRYSATTAAAQPPGTLDPTTISQYELPLVIRRRCQARGGSSSEAGRSTTTRSPSGSSASAPSSTIPARSLSASMSSRLGRGRPCCGLTARRSARAGPYGCHFPGEAHRPRHRAVAIPPCSCSTARGLRGAVEQWRRRPADSALLHVRTDGAPAGPGRLPCPAGPRTVGAARFASCLELPRALPHKWGAGLGADEGKERRIPSLRARPP